MSEARIKQMTGGDTLTARFLHAEWFEFKPEFKLWLATNHKPIVKDSTHSMWRRVRFIPFEVQILKTKQDKRLIEKLRSEYSGILNWIIEGALLWQHEGLEPPEIIQAATQNYREEMDDQGDCLRE
jgi:putative DNA primase/helicase